MDLHGFYTGAVFDAYEYLGGHLTEEGAVFRTYAPSARQVSVIGAFSGWAELPMERTANGQFWSCRVPGARAGQKYKYRVYRPDGSCLDRCDPYGFAMELRPQCASLLWDLDAYQFHDGAWMARRTPGPAGPGNIYELHAGSWRRHGPGETDWYSYRDLARELIPYLKERGYTHVELLPLAEHPSDASWGYQNTGFFSPTARYGSPDGLMELVDQCHQNGLGVILDFVSVHFAVDDYALWQYDGTPLYEYPNAAVGVSQWGSCNFMHARGDVRSFLQSAAHFWLEKYHFDGLRMDAVRNLIYWQGEEARGENAEGLRFLREMNRGLKKLHPTALLAAEDSSAHPGVTAPPEAGGLGFDYKWDMGWMHDTLSYFQLPPEQRETSGGLLTFSLHYFYGERYLLPLSHDEVVHGKGSILARMSGTPEERLAQLRALYLYLFAHPGKKLNFMGHELAPESEWDYRQALDWSLLAQPERRAFHRFFRDVGLTYRAWSPLWAWDYRPEGFQWLGEDQGRDGIFLFLRRDDRGVMLAAFQFLPRAAQRAVSLPGWGGLELLLSTGWEIYGGPSDSAAPRLLPLRDGQAVLPLPPYSGQLYRLLPPEDPVS